ncbi:biotin/lipoyl-binding protein [Rhizobium leguminosarum]|uniref:biotin/lipoyl-binding protein n=1 Tax=Rhizobium ruizarguesonis TaxID=2081791 RepID=UPI0013BFA847|nr:biotin/lipoyl-binding protein [Rhizobium ruizarguesonis]NEI19034.1 biotin/lipoyl-binding protein [Rhizobium ruizarguesonis]
MFDASVIANGQAVVSDQVKITQHRDGGILSQIMVENGDEAKKGDILLRLDEAQPGMPVEVLVKTEERSPLSFLVKPFTDRVMRIFRQE